MSSWPLPPLLHKKSSLERLLLPLHLLPCLLLALLQHLLLLVLLPLVLISWKLLVKLANSISPSGVAPVLWTAPLPWNPSPLFGL